MLTMKKEDFTLTETQLQDALQQMREKGLTYEDFWTEYDHGTQTVYGYDKKTGRYTVTQTDIMAAAFVQEDEMSPEEMKAKLAEIANLHELRSQGFIL